MITDKRRSYGAAKREIIGGELRLKNGLVFGVVLVMACCENNDSKDRKEELVQGRLTLGTAIASSLDAVADFIVRSYDLCRSVSFQPMGVGRGKRPRRLIDAQFERRVIGPMRIGKQRAAE